MAQCDQIRSHSAVLQFLSQIGSGDGASSQTMTHTNSATFIDTHTEAYFLSHSPYLFCLWFVIFCRCAVQSLFGVSFCCLVLSSLCSLGLSISFSMSFSCALLLLCSYSYSLFHSFIALCLCVQCVQATVCTLDWRTETERQQSEYSPNICSVMETDTEHSRKPRLLPKEKGQQARDRE